MFSLLKNDRYRNFLKVQTDDGRSAFTFLAMIDVLGSGEPIACYVKAYRNAPLWRGQVLAPEMSLFNECIGYLLARESGYKVPEHAGLIFVRTDNVNGRPQWMNKDWPCFFSSAVEYPSLNLFYMGLPETVKLSRLADLDDTPSVIVFDDVVINWDRNLGNLLIDKSGSVYLIDHGRILGKNFQHWLSIDFRLGHTQKENNVIRKALEEHTTKFDEPGFKTMIYLSHQKIEQALLKGAGLAAVRGRLLELMSVDRVDAVCGLISGRCSMVNASQKASVLDLR